MRYEGFYTDLYVSIIIMVALVVLYIASNPKIHQLKKRTTSYIPLLHGSSKSVVEVVQRSKTVYCGIVSIDGGVERPLYLKKHML